MSRDTKMVLLGAGIAILVETIGLLVFFPVHWHGLVARVEVVEGRVDRIVNLLTARVPYDP